MCFYRFFTFCVGSFSSGHFLQFFLRVKRRGGMGYVCTVRQLGLLYIFPLYRAF